MARRSTCPRSRSLATGCCVTSQRKQRCSITLSYVVLWSLQFSHSHRHCIVPGSGLDRVIVQARAGSNRNCRARAGSNIIELSSSRLEPDDAMNVWTVWSVWQLCDRKMWLCTEGMESTSNKIRRHEGTVCKTKISVRRRSLIELLQLSGEFRMRMSPNIVLSNLLYLCASGRQFVQNKQIFAEIHLLQFILCSDV